MGDVVVSDQDAARNAFKIRQVIQAYQESFSSIEKVQECYYSVLEIITKTLIFIPWIISGLLARHECGPVTSRTLKMHVIAFPCACSTYFICSPNGIPLFLNQDFISVSFFIVSLLPIL